MIRAIKQSIARFRPKHSGSGPRSVEEKYPPDFDAGLIEVIERVAPFTMTSPERVAALCNAVEYIVRHDIPGAFVECGVWKGGSIMAIALTLRRLACTDRDIYLFDTFEGMPPPNDVDRTFRNQSAVELMKISDHNTAWIWARCPRENVYNAIESTGINMDRVHMVRGRVEDTIPREAPSTISLLRLDTDWYQSTLHELCHLYPRIESGGVLIIDDYGHWQGARKAVDEYFGTRERRMLLNRIDYTGRIGIKDTGGLTPRS